MKKRLLTIFSLLMTGGVAFGGIRATTPQNWNGALDSWQMKRHAEKLEAAAKGGAKVVFLGDSITHNWERKGKGRAQLAKYFSEGDWKMLNLGFSADRTEHVLWRIENGELDGFEAAFINIMIGTNNTGHFPVEKESPEDTAEGIKKILEIVRQKQPKALIVLNAIFPRGEKPDDPKRLRNDKVNELIRSFADGKDVLWLDLKDDFLASDGTLPKELFPDFLHPSAEGYEIWYRAVMPLVERALSERTVNTIARCEGFNAVAFSPDGNNELRLKSGANGMAYSVWRNGKALVEPTRFSLAVEGHGTLNGADAKPEITVRTIEGTLATPLYKKSSVNLAANETRVDFGDWAVVLHARNDGVAWRFETKFDGEVVVPAESTNIRFPKGTELCYTQEGGFISGWEKPAKIGLVESVTPGHPQIVMTPFTATVPGAGVVTVTESNLRDYPGLNFYRKENEPDILRSWQAGVPKDVDKGRRKIKVVSREPYLAKTSGTRVFPWRVFVLGDTPSDLISSDIVYALAEPSRVKDTSWVKPGQVAWDWWNGFKIADVPGLETGCNFETYKEYVNFAAANGIAYIIMDEGWSEKLDLDNPREEVNVPGVIAYAKEKGVGVILWAAWAPLTDREKRLRVFNRYAAMGAKGFKIDFIERDDQIAEKFLEETAADAAERKLVVMYHGIHKPTGLQRTYPNILNYEGVYGLEQGHSIGGRKVVVSNDVNLVYTRMVAGFMDYTPGAMRNRAFDAPPFDKTKDACACYGTRCHQLALFPLFEAPIQMLCDSPTQYRTAPDCTAFITSVPTVWDETRGVAGEIGKFASVARRKGSDWWLGAITNWEARDVELPTDFLGGGEWVVEVFEDAPDADVNAENYIRRAFTIKAGEPLKVRLAPGGGFAARLSRRDKVENVQSTRSPQ